MSIRLRSKEECIIEGEGNVASAPPSWTAKTNPYGVHLWNKTFSPSTEEELRAIIMASPPGTSLIVGGTTSTLSWPLYPAFSQSALIWMWKFKKFWIDRCDKTVTVQAGVTYADINEILAENGLVVPFYYLAKIFTLIGTMSSGSSPVVLGQPSHNPGHYATRLKVMNGLGVVSTIDIGTDKDRGAAWLNSIGDLGVVLEATFKLESDYFIESSCSSLPGIEAALEGHDDWGDRTVDVTLSDPQCSDPKSKDRLIDVCKWSIHDHGDCKLDLAPVDMDTMTSGLKEADASYQPMTCDHPSMLLKSDAGSMGFNDHSLLPMFSKKLAQRNFNEGGKALVQNPCRKASNDMLWNVIWKVPENFPAIGTLYVRHEDVDVALAEVEKIREQRDLQFRMHAVNLMNYGGSHHSLLASHEDGFMIYLQSFDTNAFMTWLSRLLRGLICDKKLWVGFKYANTFPREWIGAKETTFPSMQNLKKFYEYSMLEDPLNKFSNVLTTEMFKRLGNPESLC